MDIKNIEKLAKIVNDNGLTMLSVRENDTEITIERRPDISSFMQDAASVGIIGSSDGPTSVLLSNDEETKTAESAAEGHLVNSPTVGVFYAAPSPDSESFVQIGTKVKKGDILCLVEAMKLMNEITCDFDGVVAEICVGNGQVVEYGQPLFRIV